MSSLWKPLIDLLTTFVHLFNHQVRINTKGMYCSMKEMDCVSRRWTCFGLKCAHQPKNKSKTSCEDAGWSWRECVIIYRETRSFPGRDIFGDLFCDLRKLKFGHIDDHYIWTIKGEACKPEITISNDKYEHHVIGLFSCRYTLQNRRWNTEATSQDISQEIKAWLQTGFLKKQWTSRLPTWW